MKPPHARMRQSLADRRRAATLERLIADITARTGSTPTDADLARLLARSEGAIARVRRLIDGGADA